MSQSQEIWNAVRSFFVFWRTVIIATVFPQELLDRFMECFDPISDRRTLCNCSSASRLLRQLSRKLIFSYIRLRRVRRPANEEIPGDDRCRSFCNLITEFPEIALLVRVCRLEEDDPQYFTAEHGWILREGTLPAVINRLTNLKTLSVTMTHNYRYHQGHCIVVDIQHLENNQNKSEEIRRFTHLGTPI